MKINSYLLWDFELKQKPYSYKFITMKNILTVTILFIYFCSLFSAGLMYCGLMLNSDLIAKEFCRLKDQPGNCCKGSCYISSKLNSDEDKAQFGKRAGNSNSENLSPHLIVSTKVTTQKCTTAAFTSVISYHVSTFLKPFVPPPKVWPKSFTHYLTKTCRTIMSGWNHFITIIIEKWNIWQ